MKSYSCIYLHLIWSTKNRYPFLAKSLRPHLYNYITFMAKKKAVKVMAIGGIYDHIHILVRVNSLKPMEDLVRYVKASSSTFIKRTKQNLSDFGWQNGFTTFSVSPCEVKRVTAYIYNQEEHHKTKDFDDEIDNLMEQVLQSPKGRLSETP